MIMQKHLTEHDRYRDAEKETCRGDREVAKNSLQI